MLVSFNPNGYFVEDLKRQYCLATKGNINGRMFILDVDMLDIEEAMFCMEEVLL